MTSFFKKCAISGCEKNSNTDLNLTFFNFPRNANSYVQWLQATENTELQDMNFTTIIRSKHICSRHFVTDYFCGYDKKKLLPNAVPTLHLPHTTKKISYVREEDLGDVLVVKEIKSEDLDQNLLHELNGKENSVQNQNTFSSIKKYTKKGLVDVCRMCLKSVVANGERLLGMRWQARVKQKMLSIVFPELDLNLYPDPQICTRCGKLLEYGFELKKKFLQTQFALKKYINAKSAKDEAVNLVILPEGVEVNNVILSKKHVQNDVEPQQAQPNINLDLSQSEKGNVTLEENEVFHSGLIDYVENESNPKEFRKNRMEIEIERQTRILQTLLNKSYKPNPVPVLLNHYYDLTGSESIQNVEGQNIANNFSSSTPITLVGKMMNTSPNLDPPRKINTPIKILGKMMDAPPKLSPLTLKNRPIDTPIRVLGKMTNELPKLNLLPIKNNPIDTPIKVLGKMLDPPPKVDPPPEISPSSIPDLLSDGFNSFYKGCKYKKSIRQKLRSCIRKTAWGDPPYLCSDCGKVIDDITIFKRHMSIHNNRNRVCSVCGVVLSGTAYTNHIQTHRERRYKCHLCYRKFRYQHTLEAHCTNFHSVERRLQCHVCGLVKNDTGALNTHMKTHFAELRKHKCTVCGKSFGHETYLRKHARKHAKHYFACPVCGKAIKYEMSLKRHIEIAHENKGQHKCTVCNKTYWKKQTLKLHLIKFHGGVNEERDS